ncbi:MAG: type II toxin-antitoxin system ParD family antitoxin [Pseudomonadota bacterium]
MATMNVSVPDPMRDWVQAQIEGGKYASVSDYVRDLIRRDQDEAATRERWLDALDAAVAHGVADTDAGRVVAAEAVFDRLEAKYRAMAETREAQ